MQHRAPRPLVDAWRQLPRASARLLGRVTGIRPLRAVLALVVALTLGAGAYVAVASAGAWAPTRTDDTEAADELADPPLEPAGERSTSGDGTPRSAAAPSPGSAAPDPTSAAASPAASPRVPSLTASPQTRPTQPAVSPIGTPEGSPTRTGTPSPSGSAEPSVTRTPSPSAPEDRTPPRTRVSEEYPDRDTAVFSFTADEPASFACSLDGAAYTACESPMRYADLESGWHTFAVRATDTAGNVEPTPVEIRWHTSGGGVD